MSPLELRGDIVILASAISAAIHGALAPAHSRLCTSYGAAARPSPPPSHGKEHLT